MFRRRHERYKIIYQDPAWKYTHAIPKANGGYTYPVMDLREMARLDILSLADDDCNFLTWMTFPKWREQLAVLDAWGLHYVTVLFDWVKLNPTATYSETKVKGRTVITIDGGVFSGNGRHTNTNAEVCVLARRGGGVKRLATDVKQLIFWPISDHSVKPPIYDRIQRLYGDVPSLELWARPNAYRPESWDATGLDLDGIDIRSILGQRA